MPVGVQGGAVAVDGPWIVAGARQPEIFQVSTRQKRAAEAVVDDVTDLTFAGVAVDAASHRGAVAFAAAGQPFVALYALEDGRIEGMLRYAQSNQTRAAVSLAFSPGGKLLAELRPEGLCIVWNVEERKHTRLSELEGEANRPFPLEATQVAFTRGLGPYLVLTSQMGAEVWDLDTPERLRRDTTVSGRFTLSPDGRILATRAEGGLGLYYLESFEHIRTLSVPPVHLGRPGVDLVTFPHGLFSPDGRRLAGGHLIFTGYAE